MHTVSLASKRHGPPPTSSCLAEKKFGTADELTFGERRMATRTCAQNRETATQQERNVRVASKPKQRLQGGNPKDTDPCRSDSLGEKGGRRRQG